MPCNLSCLEYKKTSWIYSTDSMSSIIDPVGVTTSQLGSMQPPFNDCSITFLVTNPYIVL